MKVFGINKELLLLEKNAALFAFVYSATNLSHYRELRRSWSLVKEKKSTSKRVTFKEI